MVTFRDAYRFEETIDGKSVYGTVFKVLPRRVSWEARIDDTDIRERAETRADAVAAALQRARQR